MPYNHGVLYVEHTVDADQAVLRTQHPHWAERLTASGYRTGFFGKWHVERSNELSRFGWQQQGALSERPDWSVANFSLERYLDSPPGYHPNRFYGVCDLPASERGMGKKTDAALGFLDSPWMTARLGAVLSALPSRTTPSIATRTRSRSMMWSRSRFSQTSTTT